MTDFHERDDDLGDEVLSAYLSGELEEAEAASLDERLARDPAVAARLDRIAEVVATLRGLDTVEPPPGFRERLDRRLAAEQAPEVAPIEAHRARRRPRWPRVGVAAAALTAVAVAATGLLQAIGGYSGDEAAEAPLARTQDVPRAESFSDDAPAPDVAQEDSDEELAAPDAPAAEAVPDEPAAGGGAGGDDTARDGLAAAPGLVRDDAVELPDDIAIRDRYRGVAEMSAVVGAPVGEAARLAAEARASLGAADVNPGGVPPTACVDAVEAAVGAPAVVILVESAVTPQGPALSHVVVSAVGERLDRVEAVLVEPGSCAPLERVLVSGGRG